MIDTEAGLAERNARGKGLQLRLTTRSTPVRSATQDTVRLHSDHIKGRKRNPVCKGARQATPVFRVHGDLTHGVKYLKIKLSQVSGFIKLQPKPFYSIYSPFPPYDTLPIASPPQIPYSALT